MSDPKIRGAVATILRLGLSEREWLQVKRAVEDRITEDTDEEELPGQKPAKPKLKVKLKREEEEAPRPQPKDITYDSAVREARLAVSFTKTGKELSSLALLGFFYECYKTWCLAKYPGVAKEHYKRVDALVKAYDAGMVFNGIRVLFDTDGPLAWVKRRDLDFLTNESHWARFVAPAIAQAKKGGGEKSEWEAQDDDEEVTVRRKR